MLYLCHVTSEKDMTQTLLDILNNPNKINKVSTFNNRSKGDLNYNYEQKNFKNDLSMQFEIDDVAYSVFVNIEGRVNDELYNQMYDYMLGFDKEMQLVIADNLLDAVIYGWEHYTYIDHVDDKLKSFYLLIDKELGRI